MQFGALTSLFTMIPVLNLVILPVAICGATAMWVDCYRENTPPGAKAISFGALPPFWLTIISLQHIDMRNPYFRILSGYAEAVSQISYS
jgi:hypothetical protein